MLNLKNRISAFVELGDWLRRIIPNLSESNDPEIIEFRSVIKSAFYYNNWFTEQNIIYALQSISTWLTIENMEEWLAKYELNKTVLPSKKIGIIMAGNIPLVGFHDLLCVLISGNIAIVKTSQQDKILTNFFIEKLKVIEPEFSNCIIEETHILKEMDVVIATGSNNSSRYFDYYFGKYPHIIRKHRNSLAFLLGTESDSDLKLLAFDIFSYFGLGCRNVSKIYLPESFEIEKLMRVFEPYSFLSQHTKYFNNYEYNRSIYLINSVKHFDNGFLIMTENSTLYSPVSVLYYEYYQTVEQLKRMIESQMSAVQCVVGPEGILKESISFGQAQHPNLDEYADNVDTMKFLIELNRVK